MTDQQQDTDTDVRSFGEDAERQDTQSEVPAPLEEWLDAVQGLVQHHVVTRPYATLLVAGTVGYVLAAGVPGFVMRAAVNAGGRVAVARLLSTFLEK